MQNKKIGDLKKYRFIFLLACSLLFILFSTVTVSATLNISLSNQGTEVRTKATGDLLALGDLGVTVWDSLSGGNLIYNETFVNGIVNGSWNVMLGEDSSNPLPLEFGRIYYYDYEIDGSDVNFTTFNGTNVGRQFFYSPLGDISSDDLSFGFFFNYTNVKTTGNITNGTLNGYFAANAICDAEYPGTHMCQMYDILNTINTNRSISNFGATFRVSEGAPGFTANANDCDGWKSATSSALGSIWVGDTTNGGSGSLVACNAERAIGCCT